MIKSPSGTTGPSRVNPTVDDSPILTDLLKLRQRSEHSQNWEAEVARPDELVKYMDCYDTANLNDDEKYALMSLILYALEDAWKMAFPETSKCESRIARSIIANHPLHLPQLKYWSLPEEASEDPDDLFCITPFIRRLASTLQGDSSVSDPQWEEKNANNRRNR